jgi:hypothetical protein
MKYKGTYSLNDLVVGIFHKHSFAKDQYIACCLGSVIYL